MKVGLVVKKIESGGIQKSYLTLFNSFRKFGHEPYLFVLNKPSNLQIKDENIVYLDGKSTFQKGFFLNKYINNIGDFDLFIVNAEYMKKYLPIDNKKIFLTVHVMWSERLGKGIKKLSKLIKLKNRYHNENIITVSQGIKDDLLYRLKVKPKSIKVISDPYDIEEIKQLSHEKIEDTPKQYIVSVGSLVEVKRHDLLIEAFSLLKNKKIELIVIGDGKLKSALYHTVQEKGLENRIHFLGFKINPYNYIKSAKLLVVSSDSEGFSRVIIEALALDTPIVSTDCSPIFKENFFPKILKQFIVPKGDTYILSQTIEKALINYPKIDNHLYESFSDKKVISEYLSLSKEIQ